MEIETKDSFHLTKKIMFSITFNYIIIIKRLIDEEYFNLNLTNIKVIVTYSNKVTRV